MRAQNLFQVFLSGCVVFLSLIASSAGALEVTDLDNPKVTEAFFDGLVLPLMQINNSPSGVIVLTKSGQTIFAKGYGYENINNRNAVKPQKTLFRPGSVSKLATWIAVMQMVENGLLDLDADINDYLKTFQLADSFPGKPVTMRHIMTHTAGFEDGALGYLILRDPALIVDLAKSLREHQPERVNPPGTQTAYSNYGASLAGLVVANISEQSFPEFIQQNIFDVLGMGRSTFLEPLPNHLSENMAMAYSYKGGEYWEQPFEILSNFSPAGALSSTGTDMAIFAQAILGGGQYEGRRILKKTTVDQMLNRNFSHDERLMGMALGFVEREENGVRLLGHGGDTQYFHSDLVIDQQNEISIFVSFVGDGGRTIRSAIASAFYDTFFAQEKNPILAPSGFSDRAEEYAGYYRPWRSSFTKFDKATSMSYGIAVTVTGDSSLLVQMPRKTSRYVEVAEHLFVEKYGPGKIAFQTNIRGKITGLVVDGLPYTSMFKAPFYYTKNFNLGFLALTILVFVGVILRFLYQKSEFLRLSGPDGRVARLALTIATVNLITIVLLGVVMTISGDHVLSEIPKLFKAWLVLPIITTLLAVFAFYSFVVVWRDGLCGSAWGRARFSAVVASAIFVCWFYYFWNLLGFNYYS
tara:strand:+ start:6819 stop:8729 length:1911 start_codon:yes stop_codon:yes gene_type:complete